MKETTKVSKRGKLWTNLKRKEREIKKKEKLGKEKNLNVRQI